MLREIDFHILKDQRSLPLISSPGAESSTSGDGRVKLGLSWGCEHYQDWGWRSSPTEGESHADRCVLGGGRQSGGGAASPDLSKWFSSLRQQQVGVTQKNKHVLSHLDNE